MAAVVHPAPNYAPILTLVDRTFTQLTDPPAFPNTAAGNILRLSFNAKQRKPAPFSGDSSDPAVFADWVVRVCKYLHTTQTHDPAFQISELLDSMTGRAHNHLTNALRVWQANAQVVTMMMCFVSLKTVYGRQPELSSLEAQLHHFEWRDTEDAASTYARLSHLYQQRVSAGNGSTNMPDQSTMNRQLLRSLGGEIENQVKLLFDVDTVTAATLFGQIIVSATV
jgi:hypothetical protein